jgi:hypothetical protein
MQEQRQQQIPFGDDNKKGSDVVSGRASSIWRAKEGLGNDRSLRDDKQKDRQLQGQRQRRCGWLSTFDPTLLHPSEQKRSPGARSQNREGWGTPTVVVVEIRKGGPPAKYNSNGNSRSLEKQTANNKKTKAAGIENNRPL